jgi:phenylalanyl-tRNA synthetase beta chain
MKISFQWLSQYIEIADYQNKLDEFSNLLTRAGLEVEGITNPAKDWNQVVVGKLLSVGKHPDAEKLTLCQVDVGQKEPLQIVCGAKNHKQGDFVAVAMVGAVLPGDFKIKQSKIRGVDSSGMLCSEKELGLSEESEGIIILKGTPEIGLELAQIPDIAAIIFELKVTPNRADCLSHIGLARELSTLLDRPVKFPKTNLNEAGKNIDDWIQVKINDSEACPRYCGRLISGVKVGQSPSWLKKSLESIGLNSVNNVVDITNFVLFEYGQPLHAFDYAEIKNSQIVIEKANNNEEFKTLDGTQIKLSDQDLVIRDGVRAVALAGVVGGQNSGVSEETKDIFIESAFFKANGVRKTSRAHGIETDACYRFSRGVDPEQTLKAMDRAAQLMIEVAGGILQKGHIDIYPEPHKAQTIEIDPQYVSDRLGFSVDKNKFTNWMIRLGCKVKESAKGFLVTCPTYRWDLQIKEDLVEEFARLHGYDSIIEKLPILNSEPTPHVYSFEFANKTAQLLSGMGLNQCVNYAFISKDQIKQIWNEPELSTKLGLTMGETPIELLNPLSEELSIMRESLLPSLIKNLVFNHNHGNLFGQIFEIAPSHFKSGNEFKEQNRLALAFWGQAESLWEKKKDSRVVYQLKSVVETFLKSIGAKSYRWQTIKN